MIDIDELHGPSLNVAGRFVRVALICDDGGYTGKGGNMVGSEPSEEQVYDLTDPGDDRPGLDDADMVDDDGDDDVFDDDDELDEVGEDEVDFVVACYREDSAPNVEALPADLANDLEMLIEELRRYPGDNGVLGMVSIEGDFFVLVRVRGTQVQVLLSDESAAEDYLIARDALDYLGDDAAEDIDDEAPIGDLDMLVDLGISEFDLEQLAGSDEDADVVCTDIAERLAFGDVFSEVVDE